MRIVHSFWGVPALTHLMSVRVNVWLYALSALYAKRNKDASMILYTDSIGKKILEPILKLYDEVHEVSVPNSIKPKFFAAIKAVALSLEPLGSVHIDGDVVLKSPVVYNRIRALMAKCDVVTQGIEPNLFTYNEAEYFDKHNINMGCTYKHTSPCNVGVLGFHCQTLKNAYLRNYFKYSTMLSGFNDLNECNIPDIILEQAYLSSYTKQNGYLMGEVVSGLEWKDILANANRYGYVHLWADSKYSSLNVIKDKMRKVFPMAYSMLCSWEANHQKIYEIESLGQL